jgi:hypothetical protein
VVGVIIVLHVIMVRRHGVVPPIDALPPLVPSEDPTGPAANALEELPPVAPAGSELSGGRS